MLRRSQNKTKTVAEKVNALLAHPNGSDSSEDSADEATAPRIEDFDEDEYELPDGRSTEIRKRNVKLLSEQSARYKGKIVSRKDLEQSDDDDDDAEKGEPSDSEAEAYEPSDSENEDDLTAFANKLKGARVNLSNGKKKKESDEDNRNDDDEESDDDDVSGDDDVDDFGDDDDDETGDDDDDETGDDNDEESGEDDEKNNSTINPNDIVSKQNHQMELQKGVCVQNQLQIWERLLELRINSQKVLNKSNKLPTPEVLQGQRLENKELDTEMKTAQEGVGNLLKQLLELQGALTHQNSEVKNALKDSQKRPAPFSGDSPDPKRLATHLQGQFEEFRTYRNSVLLRWDDRTRLLTPGAGAKKKSMQEDFDIIKKIENSLANRSTLIAKSQTLKNDTINSAPKELKEVKDGEAPDDLNEPPTISKDRLVNIYDDSDFYHQQLRELIEYKANTSTNISEITKQFVELQKLRQKMKKKVDTRASKGRKIRYVVHNKLINFMAPNEASDWTEESKNELYRSLFV